MSDHSQTEQTLMDGIEALADKAAKSNSAGSALKLAAAANQLAEAKAWLNQTNQPHGGFSYGEGGSR